MQQNNHGQGPLNEINRRIRTALSVFEGDCPEARQKTLKEVLDEAFEDGLLAAKPVWRGLNVTIMVRPEIHPIDITCTLSYGGEE